VLKRRSVYVPGLTRNFEAPQSVITRNQQKMSSEIGKLNCYFPSIPVTMATTGHACVR